MRGAGGLAVAGDDVDDARREAGLLEQLAEAQRRERRLLGRLQHDGVAAGERDAELPRRHQQREVPRDDLADDADRLAQRAIREPSKWCRRSNVLLGTLPHDVDVLVVGAGPAGVAAGIEAQRARPLDARRRQGALPAGQDVRRRPHHRGAAPARRPRARRPQAAVVRLGARDRDRRPRRARGLAPAPPRRRARRRGAAAASSTPRSVLLARSRGVELRDGVRPARREHDGRRARRDPRRRHRGPRAVAHRRRRPLLRHASPAPRGLHAEPADVPDLGTWHAFRQYFRGVDDPRLWVLFERDLLPGVRVGVPGRWRPRQRRVRRAARRRRRRQAARRPLARRPRPPERATDPRRSRGARRAAPRVADPRGMERSRAHRRAARALRRRRGRRGRPDDGRRHRAGARDRHARGARGRVRGPPEQRRDAVPRRGA